MVSPYSLPYSLLLFRRKELIMLCIHNLADQSFCKSGKQSSLALSRSIACMNYEQFSLQFAVSQGRRPNGFLGLSLNDRTILFLVILFDRTVSVG